MPGKKENQTAKLTEDSEMLQIKPEIRTCIHKHSPEFATIVHEIVSDGSNTCDLILQFPATQKSQRLPQQKCVKAQNSRDK